MVWIKQKSHRRNNETEKENAGNEQWLESLSLNELFTLNEQHQNHLLFLKNLGRLNDTKESTIFKNMEKTF